MNECWAYTPQGNPILILTAEDGRKASVLRYVYSYARHPNPGTRFRIFCPHNSNGLRSDDQIIRDVPSINEALALAYLLLRAQVWSHRSP